MHRNRTLVRPVPDPPRSRLDRVRDWLLEDHRGGTDRGGRAEIAALLRWGPPW